MVPTLILRLAPAALRAGVFAGEVECVESGRRAVVRSVEEVLAFVRDLDVPPRRPAPAEEESHADDRPG